MKTIIIEGTNGTGKSTLAEQLADRYAAIIKHGGGSTKTHAECIKRCEEQLELIEEGNFILDRSVAISDQIYKHYSESGLRMLTPYMAQIKSEAIVIYCVGKGEPVDNNNKAHYDKTLRLKVVKDRKKLSDMYQTVMDGIPHIVYDFNANNGFDDLIKRIET